MRWSATNLWGHSYSTDLRTATSSASWPRTQVGAPLPNTKTYSEVTYTQLTNVRYGTGLSDAQWVFAGTGYSYAYDTKACGVLNVASDVELGAFTSWIAWIKGSALAVNDVLCIAVDRPNNRAWLRINNGNWNGSGTANPATNTGGIDISSLSGDVRIVHQTTDPGTGVAVKINCGQEAFTYTAPSGFGTAIANEALDLVGCATGTNTATLPAHQAGDLILAFAFRDGSTTAPTVPGGQNWTTEETGGANACSSVLVSKMAAGGSEGVGTFTNATSVVVGVWRPRASYSLATGSSNANGGSSTTVNYAALTLDSTAGKSHVAAFGGHCAVDGTLNLSPTGLAIAAYASDGTDLAVMHMSHLGQTANWASSNVSIAGTSSGWRSHVVEIKANAAAVTLTANAGGLTLGGQAAGLLFGRVAGGAAGSFGLTGQSATLSKGFGLVAGAGALNFAGQTAGVLTARRLDALAAGPALAGQAATLAFGALLSAAGGAFGMQGQDATLGKGSGLTASVGALSLAGPSAGLPALRRLDVQAGAVVLTGQGVSLKFDAVTAFGLAATPGVFAMIGAADLSGPIWSRLEAPAATWSAAPLNVGGWHRSAPIPAAWSESPRAPGTWTDDSTPPQTWTPA